MNGAIDAAALHARIDGRLPPERMAAVDRYLAEHPEEQRRWSDYAAQRQALREAFVMPVCEPIPERLRTPLPARFVERGDRQDAAEGGKSKRAPPAGGPS
jgi:anti-sigma factor RsiW